MLRDGRIDESKMNDVSLDEFDPANDIDDYPADDQPEKVIIVSEKSVFFGALNLTKIMRMGLKT